MALKLGQKEMALSYLREYRGHRPPAEQPAIDKEIADVTAAEVKPETAAEVEPPAPPPPRRPRPATPEPAEARARRGLPATRCYLLVGPLR